MLIMPTLLPPCLAGRQEGSKVGMINIVLIFNKHVIFLQRLLGLPWCRYQRWSSYWQVDVTNNLVGLCGHSCWIFLCESPEEWLRCIAEKCVMNQLPKSLLRGVRRRATVPWSKMGVLHPIHCICFRSVQSLDVPFFISMGDWEGYSTYALIRKNEYYMRRNLIQVYYC